MNTTFSVQVGLPACTRLWHRSAKHGAVVLPLLLLMLRAGSALAVDVTIEDDYTFPQRGDYDYGLIKTDINFSNDMPVVGETITIAANIHNYAGCWAVGAYGWYSPDGRSCWAEWDFGYEDPTANITNISFRCRDDVSVHWRVELDGVELASPTVPGVGSSSHWKIVTLHDVTVTPGSHTLFLGTYQMDSAPDYCLDWVEIGDVHIEAETYDRTGGNDPEPDWRGVTIYPRDIPVQIWDGMPDGGGTLLCERLVGDLNTVIDRYHEYPEHTYEAHYIKNGGQATAEVEWTPRESGTHYIFVVVDPENTMEEINEDNNIAEEAIDVAPASGCSCMVWPDGSGDCPTIQDAVDGANDGDVICLADGTYMGVGNRNIDYGGKAITVKSVSANPEACVIDCYNMFSGLYRGFTFQSGESSDSVLDGVTIRNGDILIAPPDPDFGGGAILCLADSSPTIRDCRLVGNRAGFGGGLCCVGSDPTITGCVITGNRADASGGGIACHDGAWPNLINCTISGNRASQYGGGIFGACMLENTIVWGNGAEEAVGCEWYANGGCYVVCCNDLNEAGCAGFGSCITMCDFGNKPNISPEDPLFCDPWPAEEAPTTAGDYAICACSPCAADHCLMCGLIGALDVGCYPGCMGDLDCEDDVDLSDLAILLAAYGACEGDSAYNPCADLDGNGCVELSDLAALLSVYGTQCE